MDRRFTTKHAAEAGDPDMDKPLIALAFRQQLW